MVSYPQPYPIVTHQSPAHGAGGGPGSQCRDSIGMGHVTRQVKLISAAVTHSTSTDSLYTTRLSDNLGPIRSGPDSRSRTVTRYCNKEKYSAHDFTTLLFPIKRIYITLSSLDDSCSTVPAPPYAFVAYSSIYKFFKPFFDTSSELLSSSEPFIHLRRLCKHSLLSQPCA